MYSVIFINVYGPIFYFRRGFCVHTWVVLRFCLLSKSPWGTYSVVETHSSESSGPRMEFCIKVQKFKWKRWWFNWDMKKGYKLSDFGLWERTHPFGSSSCVNSNIYVGLDKLGCESPFCPLMACVAIALASSLVKQNNTNTYVMRLCDIPLCSGYRGNLATQAHSGNVTIFIYAKVGI